MRKHITPPLDMMLISLSGRFIPFSDQSINVNDQTIESSRIKIIFYGRYSMVFKRDKTGLANIRPMLGRDYDELADLIIPVIRKIEFALLCVNELPENTEDMALTIGPNTFVWI